MTYYDLQSGPALYKRCDYSDWESKWFRPASATWLKSTTPRVACKILSHLKSPNVDLSIEAFKVAMAKMLVEDSTHKQFFVSYGPRTTMGQPGNYVLIPRCRNDLVKLCGEVWAPTSWTCAVGNPDVLNRGNRIVMISVVNESWSQHPLFLWVHYILASHFGILH